MEINYTKLLVEKKWDDIVGCYTVCVGWDVCDCRRCRSSRIAITHILEAKKEVFNELKKAIIYERDAKEFKGVEQYKEGLDMAHTIVAQTEHNHLSNKKP